MASLKELRNRIASVKATQKITKAKQMVAAAKLRRAQEAAEAARPYAERMGAVLPALPRPSPAAPMRRGCWPAPAQDKTHLLVVCTADRGLCGAFNSSIARAGARPRGAPAGGRQDGQVPVRRQEGLRRPAARTTRSQIIDHIDLRDVKRIAFADADAVGREGARTCSTTASSTSARCSSREFRSVISQVPTALQLIPAEIEGGEEPRRSPAPSTNTSRTRRRSSPNFCRATCPIQIFRALLENAARRAGRQDDRHGQRDAQRRRHDRAT